MIDTQIERIRRCMVRANQIRRENVRCVLVDPARTLLTSTESDDRQTSQMSRTDRERKVAMDLSSEVLVGSCEPMAPEEFCGEDLTPS